MKYIAAAIAVSLVVAGCAKRPDSIAPAYVSEFQYSNLTCKQLTQESARLNAAYTQVAQAQNDAATGDAWGVFLIGMPTSTLSGSNVASQVAAVKGQQQAVQKAMIVRGCT